MAHFAEINSNNIVLRVLVVSNEQEVKGQDFLSNDLNLGGNWIKTSYNNNIRKKFAAIGDTYDNTRDAFIAPKPNNSIGFDEDKCQWIVPKIDTI